MIPGIVAAQREENPIFLKNTNIGGSIMRMYANGSIAGGASDDYDWYIGSTPLVRAHFEFRASEIAGGWVYWNFPTNWTTVGQNASNGNYYAQVRGIGGGGRFLLTIRSAATKRVLASAYFWGGSAYEP